MRPVRAFALVAALAVIVVGLSACTPPPGNIRVDFTAVIRTLDRRAVAMDETGYQSPNVLATDTVEQARVRDLHLGYMRMDLHWSTPGDPTSKIVCGGGGCDTGPTGDQWIAAIKGAGAAPAVIVATATPSDDANMVRHFNVGASIPNAVHYWIIGNEPDLNGYSAATYSADFNADAAAMKAVDPTIKIIGPTTAWFDQPFIQTFLQNTHPDGIDFHGYPQQGSTNGDIPTLFSWASGTGNGVATAHAMAQSILGHDVPVQVGEFELNWGGNAQNNTNFHSVWVADVLGQVLAHDGLAMEFGTKGNAIEWATGPQPNQDTGTTVNLNLDDPKAPWWGYAMFTGGTLFRPFGTQLVSASTSLANVDVWASTNAKSIVVVNKSTTAAQTGQFGLAGVGGGTAVAVWQRHPGVGFFQPPVHLPGTAVGADGTFSYPLPALSVTTFVVG